MCGIFGIAIKANASIKNKKIDQILDSLYKNSESRGKESSGILVNRSGNLVIAKSNEGAKKFIKTKEYKKCLNIGLNQNKRENTIILGHSRLVTNGRGCLNRNNQPIYSDNIAIVHNGIIVNDKDVFKDLQLKPKTEVDTEAIVAAISNKISLGNSIENAINLAFKDLKGSASIALTRAGSSELILYTNTGSLYYFIHNDLIIFASEKYILENVIKESFGFKVNELNIINTPLGMAKSFCIESLKHSRGDLEDLSQEDYPNFRKIKRCAKCILPFTFPHIEFDQNGVCNYCNNYKKIKLREISELKNKIQDAKNSNLKNCLVGISGGRDSCYGLHIIKKELELNPISFTYDWGLVTDEARRNIAKICGKLGIENIVVSADIAKKRSYVRKNIQAWIKKPSLKMIPLFMAGDKLFYYYAHKLRRQTKIPLFIFCAGNELESTAFKVGFNGVKEGSKLGILTSLNFKNKIILLMSYLLEVLKNPYYINSSIIDTLKSFHSSYFLKDDYIYLYHYYEWNEVKITKLIKDEYDWVGAVDTTSTWRTGDGTSSFYNYIYYTVAGFTENDTFRSNQIREGVITRNEAMDIVEKENLPRWISLQEYANTIGFNLDEALLAIHRMKKLY